MFHLPWSKTAKANRLMSKLSTLYHTHLNTPLSPIPEVAELQRESMHIELAKIAHTHYLLRREHIHSYPPSSDRLPLSPGIVIPHHTSVDLAPIRYLHRYSILPQLSPFFQRALHHANHVHLTECLASLSSELSHTFTHSDALVLVERLPLSTQPYFYQGKLSLADLSVLAAHFKRDIIKLT